MPPFRPIGYWVRLLDELLERSLDAVLSDHGVTRREWQVLNTIAGGVADRRALEEALAPFTRDARTAVDKAVGALTARGWLEHDRLSLTGDGTAAHERLAGTIAQTRRMAADGVETAAYETTVATLERMARNLGWNEADATA